MRGKGLPAGQWGGAWERGCNSDWSVDCLQIIPWKDWGPANIPLCTVLSTMSRGCASQLPNLPREDRSMHVLACFLGFYTMLTGTPLAIGP